MKEDKAFELAKRISHLNGNYSAEIIIADLLESGFSEKDFVVTFKGIFRRPFRKDILKVNKTETGPDYYYLDLDLSRNGIYDLLPQAMCHGQGITNSGKKINVKDLTNVYARRKEEEKETRKFFFPFEYEMFLQLLALEKEERRLLYGYRNLFKAFLISFWDLKGSLPEKQLAGLLEVLPYMNKLSGNFELITTCLEEVLGVKVEYAIKYEEEKMESGTCSLGNNRLSQSFVLSSNTGSLPCAEFKFSQIEENDLVDFLEGGKIRVFINKFFEYSIPLEFKTDIKIVAFDTVKKKQKESIGILGYTLKI